MGVTFLIVFICVTFGLSLGIWLYLGVNFLGIALLLIGIFLILSEMFVVPGALYPFFLGTLFVVGGIIVVSQENVLVTHFSLVVTSFSLEALGLLALFTLMHHDKMLEKHILLKENSPTGGLQEEQTLARNLMLGQQGKCIVELRPAGRIEIGDKFYDVVSNGDFIPKGEQVQIVDVSSNRIMVEKIEG